MTVDAMQEAKAHEVKIYHFCSQENKSLQLLTVPQDNGIGLNIFLQSNSQEA